MIGRNMSLNVISFQEANMITLCITGSPMNILFMLSCMLMMLSHWKQQEND